jgi:ferredoxin
MRVCNVGCVACKACQRASKLFTIQDNLSVIDYDAYQPDDLGEAIAAMGKCPRKRLLFVGKPGPDILEALADKELPAVVTADFKTTVDDTEWRG